MALFTMQHLAKVKSMPHLEDDASDERKTSHNTGMSASKIVLSVPEAFCVTKDEWAQLLLRVNNLEEKCAKFLVSEHLPVLVPGHPDEVCDIDGRINQAEPKDVDVAGANVELFVEDMEVELDESLWDVALLMGLKQLPVITNVCVFILVLVNVFAQLTFCIAIGSHEGFTEPGLPSNDRMMYWRATAHDASNSDSVTGTSLVARVCNQDSSLQVASGQSDTVSDVGGYFAELDYIGTGSGLTVFTLAWFLWALTAYSDVAANLQLYFALLVIPRGFRTQCDNTEEGLQLSSVSFHRIMVMTVLSLVRLFVCSQLFFNGTIWLANTVSIQDIMLNAAALGFVLDLDNLIFEVFTPPVVRSMLSSFKPFRLPRYETKVARVLLLQIGVRPIFALVILGSTFVWIRNGEIAELQSQLKQLNDTLCAGNIDFQWTQWQTFSHTFLMTCTPHYIDDINGYSASQTYKLQAVQQQWNSSWCSPQLWHGPSTFDGIMSWSPSNIFLPLAKSPIDKLTYWPMFGSPDCVKESAAVSSVQFLWAMRKTALSPNASSCEEFRRSYVSNPRNTGGELVSACALYDAALIRMSCPSECGCSDPRSGLYLSGNRMGCPKDRCIRTSAFTNVTDSLPCIDPSPEEMKRIPGWSRYWEEFVGAQTYVFGDWFYLGRYNQWSISSLAKKNGCAFLRDDAESSLLIGEFCFENFERGSVVAFCPETCGCRLKPGMLGCPSSC